MGKEAISDFGWPRHEPPAADRISRAFSRVYGDPPAAVRRGCCTGDANQVMCRRKSVAYQLVRQLIVAAAVKHDQKATEISLLGAARLVVRFSHHMAAAPAWALPIYYERLLDAIAAHKVDVRPGRLEPRALTREWKHYPHLRLTRPAWRKQRLRRLT